jgi:hypothetical protein
MGHITATVTWPCLISWRLGVVLWHRWRHHGTFLTQRTCTRCGQSQRLDFDIATGEEVWR